jgi:hypothetical protein
VPWLLVSHEPFKFNDKLKVKKLPDEPLDDKGEDGDNWEGFLLGEINLVSLVIFL